MLPTQLRDINVSKCYCTLSKNKETGKDVIKLHALPGRRTNISCQFGDDDMVDAEGNPAPLVPLRGPCSFEDTQPDKPSIFTRCADAGSIRVLQAIDALLPEEMKRLGVDKEYKPENYRPLYHAPDPESGSNGSGAVSLKFDKKKCPVTIMELEDPDDDESEISREGELEEIQPGVTESMYTRMSISSIWKGRGKNADWGVTIWVNKMAARMGVQDDGLVIGSKVLRGSTLKDVKSKSSKRGRSSANEAPAKRVKRESSESEGEGDDDFSTAPEANRTEASEPVGDVSDAGSVGSHGDDDDVGSVEGSDHEDQENDASAHESEGAASGDEDQSEEERVPTPPPAPKAQRASKSSKPSRSSRPSRK
jgi:hypothetical protein